jgi:hypothetical protein
LGRRDVEDKWNARDDRREGLELTADEVGDALMKLVAEVREGFDRLRNLI